MRKAGFSFNSAGEKPRTKLFHEGETPTPVASLHDKVFWFLFHCARK